MPRGSHELARQRQRSIRIDDDSCGGAQARGAGREQWVVGEHGYASRSANSCFFGRTFDGVVKLTVAAGTIAHRAPVAAEVAA